MSKHRIHTHHFKLKLIKEGLKEKKCERCKLENWLDSPIPLELHHKDGDCENNKIENIEILCPNCHALTPNYRGKARKEKRMDDKDLIILINSCYTRTEVIKKVKAQGFQCRPNEVSDLINQGKAQLLYSENGDVIMKRNKTILERYGSFSAVCYIRINWPSKDELEKMIKEKSLCQIARDLNTNLSSVRKKAKRYGIDVLAISPSVKKYYNRNRYKNKLVPLS